MIETIIAIGIGTYLDKKFPKQTEMALRGGTRAAKFIATKAYEAAVAVTADTPVKRVEDGGN